MNESVIRAYYEATSGGTNLTAYRSTMLSLFQAFEPTITVTAQRLSDQVRAIRRLYLLNESVFEWLHSNLQQLNTVNRNKKKEVINLNFNVLLPKSTVSLVSNQDNKHMRRALEDAISKYKSMPPNIRPQLPPFRIHRHNLALVNVMDKILKQYLENIQNLSDTHSILYCGAVAVCSVASVKIPTNKTVLPTKTALAWQARIEK
ncbi:unnamed protein product [Euphydryas editha]|uniref:Uncharacterized protein n=1 Tax=Euphydryas editha TaxID=104508 RepID=A0AAU9U2N7_EUPED|nr:unnamed protein product [Euphydryas editha]